MSVKSLSKGTSTVVPSNCPEKEIETREPQNRAVDILVQSDNSTAIVSACEARYSTQKGIGAQQIKGQQITTERPRLSTELGPVFDRQSEFPNFFLKAPYRTLPPEKVPSGEVERAAQKLEQAVGSVLRRLTLPIVTGEANNATMVRYFETIEGPLKEIDDGLSIFASGGVVRAAIGFVYQQIHEGMALDPPRQPQETLQRLSQDTADIPGHLVRGIGSDFDLLLRGDADSITQAKEVVLDITNSAEERYDVVRVKGAIKRSLFTVGDVKDWRTQTERSTNQGGATIDFLSYDVREGQFVLPDSHPNIVEDLVCGVYHYIAPRDARFVEDGPKQTIRGLRSLLELPFLAVADEALFRSELEALLDSEENRPPTEQALEQFAKMVRNGRWGGAHNRFFRAARDSLEALALSASARLSKSCGQTLIPRFVDHRPIDRREGTGTELNGLPQRLLTSPAGFRAEHGEKIFHGTSSPESALAILRGGLFLSDCTQGMAVFGRGGYASCDPKVAETFAGNDGVVFELDLATDGPVNILNWEDPKIRSDPFIKRLEDRVATPDMSEAERRDAVFEVLARDHGIDIIVHEHVLIQNADAVTFPAGVGGLVRSYATLVKNRHASLDSRVRAAEVYQNLYEFARGLGADDVEAPDRIIGELLPDLEEALRGGTPALRLTAGIGLLELGTEDHETEVASVLTELYAKPGAGSDVQKDDIERYRQIRRIGEHATRPAMFIALAKVAHHDADGLVKSGALAGLAKPEAALPEVEQTLAHLLNESSGETSQAVADTFAEMGSIGEEAQTSLRNTLARRNRDTPSAIIAAARALERLGMLSPEDIEELVIAVNLLAKDMISGDLGDSIPFLEILERVGSDHPKFGETLRTVALHDPDFMANVRGFAMMEKHEIEERVVFYFMMEKLVDPEDSRCTPEVRTEAIRVLSAGLKNGSSDARDILLDVAEREPDRDIRVLAQEALSLQ